MKIGYIKSSLIHDDIEVQIEKLKNAGCEKIFHEMMKRKKSTNSKEELDKCLSYCKEGDEFYVTSLHLCAKTLQELHFMIKNLNLKGATFNCIDDDLKISSSTESKSILDLLSIFAKFQGNISSERQVKATCTVRNMERKIVAKRKL